MENIYCTISADVPTVNYHLWKPCNMQCGFCFATFIDIPSHPSGHVDKAGAFQIVSLISQGGFRKINFAGGEPTLCPWLIDLIRRAKAQGLTTSVVTNGSRVTDAWLESIAEYLDILAVSIDSIDPGTQQEIGRTVNGKPPMEASDYLRIGESVRKRGIRLKVNTVVNRYNLAEDFRSFIKAMNPERWKIFQTLPVEGQNDRRIGEFVVTETEFARYVARNRSVGLDGISVVPEGNELMTGSYLMIDPLGRFFDDTKGEHTYSRPILEVGVKGALEDIEIYPDRFAARDGLYD